MRMISVNECAALKDMVKNAKSIYVVLGANPNYDAVAAALSLYLSFQQAGKYVQISCATPMRVEFSYLVGVDQIKEKLGSKNLVISFNYSEESVEKVTYAIDEATKRFNLVIAPRTGGKPLDPATVDYTLAGAEADLVFLVGVSQLEDLGALYTAEQYFFDSSYTISLTTYQSQPFARMTLDTTGQTCLAEGVGVLLTQVEFEPKDDIATNLLSSIEQATNRFQSLGVGPDTFELIAKLMRNGARRSATNPALGGTVQQGVVVPTPTISPQFQAVPASTSTFAEAMKAKSAGQQPVMQAQQSVVQPPQQPPSQQIIQLERTDQISSSNGAYQPTQPPPQEWTQPKIFTGATKV